MKNEILKSIEEIDNIDQTRLERGSRVLTAGETSKLKDIFGKSVDYNKIRVHRGHLILIFSEGLTLRNNMFFRKDDYLPDFSILDKPMGLMAHECCHVWQYQNKINRYHWTKALAEHIKYQDDVYKYDLDATKALTNYRFEQQGQIIQDYYYEKSLNRPVKDFEDVIYKSIIKNKSPLSDD